MSDIASCQHEWKVAQSSVRMVGDVFHDLIRCETCGVLRYGYTWAGLGLVVCRDAVPTDPDCQARVSALRRCEACDQAMTPAEGDSTVCRSCRLGPPDASLERAMTGIRAR